MRRHFLGSLRFSENVLSTSGEPSIFEVKGAAPEITPKRGLWLENDAVELQEDMPIVGGRAGTQKEACRKRAVAQSHGRDSQSTEANSIRGITTWMSADCHRRFETSSTGPNREVDVPVRVKYLVVHWLRVARRNVAAMPKPKRSPKKKAPETPRTKRRRMERRIFQSPADGSGEALPVVA